MKIKDRELERGRGDILSRMRLLTIYLLFLESFNELNLDEKFP